MVDIAEDIRKSVESDVRRIAMAARHALPALAQADRATKDAALRAAAASIRATCRQDQGRERQGPPVRGAERPERRDDRPAAAQRPADRGHRPRARSGRRPARSRRARRSPNGSGRTACASRGSRVPLGVIGIIYESRPNVTADAGGLCLKSGNAAILRGGSESFHSVHDHCRMPAGRAAPQQPAGGRHTARADARQGGRRRDASHGRPHRHHRAARRQVADRARHGGIAHPGHRPSRGELPRLHPRKGRSRNGAPRHPERKDAPDRGLRGRRNRLSSTARSRPGSCPRS